MKKRVLKRNGILAWHFTNGMTLRDGSLLVVGKTYRHDADLVMCASGLHASCDVMDALRYAPGATLSLVRCWGGVEMGGGKLVCSRRTVLATRDVSRELRVFACWCVRQVWHLLADERSRAAVDTAERYARSEATREDLDAARAAAWAAARNVARDAAWAAARAAAWAAARDATRNAAWDAARAVARDAARDAQRAEFSRVMSAAFADDLAIAQAREGGR